MTDATYATQTPHHEPYGPREVDCCVQCAPIVVDLRQQLSAVKTQARDYKIMHEQTEATLANVRAQLDALANRTAAYYEETRDLRAVLHDHGIKHEVKTIYQRLPQTWRDEGVEIGERVEA